MTDMDIDGDGTTQPWERLCYYVIAGCIALTFGMQVI